MLGFRRSSRLWFCALASSFAAFAAAPLGAQSVAFATFSGTVTDAAGRPLVEAEVRVRDRDSGAERRSLTARDGTFRFRALVPAVYDVSAELLGFRPMVHTGVAIVPGSAVEVRLMLNRAAPPVNAIDTVSVHRARAQPLAWVAERGYADLVGGRRLLSDVAGLSPLADRDGLEGLSWRLTEAMVDGARLGSVGQPRALGAETATLGAPLRALGTVGVGGVGFDVEASGTGVGFLATSARAGGVNDRLLITEGGTANVGGALALGTAMQRDTAYATVGADYQRSEVAPPAWFGARDALGAQLATVAVNSHATGLGAYLAETKQIEERWSTWGRFDWQQGDRLAVTLRAAVSRLQRADPPLLAATAAGLGSRQSTTAGQVSLNILARITDRISGELRVSGDVGVSSARGPELVPTTFASRGLRLGGAIDEPFEDSRTSPRLSGMVHIDLGAHLVKTGFAVSAHQFGANMTPGARGAFRFGDAADFTNLEGAWYGLENGPGAVSFRAAESAFFIQDAWRVSDALELTFGLRADRMRLPTGEIEANSGWALLSGLDNTDVADGGSRVAPRVGFRWELGPQREWVIDGGAGVYHQLPDRRDLAEGLAFDRGATVRYGVGALGSWPAAPAIGSAPTIGHTISMLGPKYEGPRTRRATLQVQRTRGTWTTYASGVYRHTDFLTRRRDLNLPDAPVGADQDGRPLYGAIQQAGAILAAAPQSNRRFGGFDAVYALEATGTSDFWALSAGVDRVVERGLSLAVNYTHARTEDNALGLTGNELSPFPDGLGGTDWQSARADSDAPHRALVAAEWRAGTQGAFRLGGVYRLRSGERFTAGFRDGVDANGDGDAYNDPAFVRSGAAGLQPLLDDWECLRLDLGRFAQRNNCQADWSHRLDLRLSVRLAALRIGRVDLVVDALDVLGLEQGPIDRALWLVDRTGTVTVDPGAGVTTMPLVVNPAFGERLADRSPGMLWRVGLRIGR